MSAHHTYEAHKAAWLRAHPNATPSEIEAASRAIARKLGI